MCLEVLKPVSHHLLIVIIIGHLTCVSSQTICACKNETEDILQELQILKSITKSLQQNVSTLMSEREILQKNLTQLQELGLNKIPSHSLTVMQDDLKGIDNSVTANQHQITSLKDDLVYIHTLTRNTTAILQNISNVIAGQLACVSSQTICACKNETEDILLELQILKSITNTLQQNFSLLMLEKEILQKNLTQLQDDHDNILSQQVLGLNKIQRNKVKVMLDDLIGIGNSVAANQHQITSLKDDLVYIHGQMRNTTAILHQLSNDYKTKIGFTAKNNDSIDPLADGEKIIIDTVVSNFGNGYDPSTGIFTAVKSGTYLLFVDVRSVWTTDDKTCWIDLMRNGSPITTVFLISSGTSMSSDSTLAIVHLDIGNKVWLRKRHHWHAGVCSLDNHLTFSGYLLNVM